MVEIPVNQGRLKTARTKLNGVSDLEWHGMTLTVHNWQNWERVFLSCHCHEIYRVEEVDLERSNHTLKIAIFVGEIIENLQQKFESRKSLGTWVTHIIMIFSSTLHFLST